MPLFIRMILYLVLYFFIKFFKSISFFPFAEKTIEVCFSEIGKKAIGPIFVNI